LHDCVPHFTIHRVARRIITLSFVLLLAPRLAAQPGGVPPPAPTLLTVFPCGAKAGTFVDVTLAGVELDQIGSLHFSAPGITAQSLGKARFRIHVEDDAPIGIHDVRVVTQKGITNPRAFVVGDRIEVVEREPNDDVPQAQRIELEQTVNGVIAASTRARQLLDVEHR
jgi:hypothetical protein